jgi:hypothetical protein
MLTLNQKAQYPCKFVGLHFIHNYLMLVREKLLDKTSVLLIDIRAQPDYT